MIYALDSHWLRGLSHVEGVLDMEERPDPITAAQGAERLQIPVSRIYVWAHRYNARKARRGRTVYYDWHDLKTIARQVACGLPVPATPEERDRIREQIRSGVAA